MENVQIRKVTKREVLALQKIGRKTFNESFGGANTPTDMEQYLDDNFSLTKVRDQLSNPDSAFYFAELGTEITGYLKVNMGSAQTESNIENSMEIERVYVLSAFQGKKIGQLLLNKALEVASSQNMKSVWLGVWDQNKKAIKFYKRNGFIEFDRHKFLLGKDEQTDIMMVTKIG